MITAMPISPSFTEPPLHASADGNDNEQTTTQTNSCNLQHIGRLPASVQSIIPNCKPSHLIIVVSENILKQLGLTKTTTEITTVLVNDYRQARIYSADDLLLSSSKSKFHSSLALLSPCLYSCIKHKDPTTTITYSPATSILKETIPLNIVILSVIFHPFLIQSDRALTIANLAQQALIGRDAYINDIIPISNVIWLRISSINNNHNFQSTPYHVITKATKIAVRTSSIPSSNESVYTNDISISSFLRQWTNYYYRSLKPQRFIKVANTTPISIDHLLDAYDCHEATHRPSLIGMFGSLRDIRYKIQNDIVPGRHVLQPIISTSLNVISCVARLELMSNNGILIITRNVESEEMAKTIVHTLSSRRKETSQSYYNTHHGNDCKGISIIICAKEFDDIHIELKKNMDFILNLKQPDEYEKKQIFQLYDLHVDNDPSVHKLLKLTSDFSFIDTSLLANFYDSNKQKYKRTIFKQCEERVKLFKDSIVTIDSGNVKWEDIGGLEEVKHEIRKLMKVIIRKDKEDDNNKDSKIKIINSGGGILLYGPPGTGKTLLAKAISNEYNISFLSIKGPELLDMYIGESERKIRKIFEQAKKLSPCILFFDEIDALTPSRNNNQSNDVVMNRIVSQLLIELDNSLSYGIIIIAATNRPDLIDVAITRPGRLDKLIYVGVSQQLNDLEIILKAQTRKFTLHHDVNFKFILSKIIHTDRQQQNQYSGFSGADLYGLASNAWIEAAKRQLGMFTTSTSISSNGVDENENENENRDDINVLCQHEHQLESLDKRIEDLFATHDDNGNERESIGDGDGSDEGEKIEGEDEENKKKDIVVMQQDFLESAKSLKPSLSLSQIQEYESLRQRMENGQ